jgi:hypothetical protein
VADKTPDISRTNVARVLREAAQKIAAKAGGVRKGFSDLNFAENELRALASALDALPSVTWEERVERASLAAVNLIGAWTDADGREERVSTRRAIGDAALRAGFSEYAP